MAKKKKLKRFSSSGETAKFPIPRSDSFLGGYLEAALWSSMDESNEDTGGEPLDENYGINDVSDELMKESIADCNKFERENAADLQATGADDARNGHDFWLTRNGHGAGFWDRGYEEDLGERLSEAARKFGEKNLYVGDDGKIYG